MLNSFVWFIFGSLTTVLLYRVLKIIPSLRLIKNINLAILAMLYGIEKIYLIPFSHVPLSENERENVENAIIAWKELTILMFFENYPKEMHKLIPFHSWAQAMKYFEENRK